MLVLSWRVVAVTAMLLCNGCASSSRAVEPTPAMPHAPRPVGAPQMLFGDEAPDALKLCVPDRINAFLLRDGWACLTLGQLRDQLRDRRFARR